MAIQQQLSRRSSSAGMPATETIACQRPVNVCYLIDDLRTGGTETQLLKLIERLDRTRIRPHLCLLNGTSDSSRQLEPTSCPVVRLGVQKLLSPRCLLPAMQFRRQLKRWQIDILQVHFPDSTYFGVPVAKLAGVPHIIRTRRDLFYWVTSTHRRWGSRLDNFYNRRFVDAMIVNSEAVKSKALADERLETVRIEVIGNLLDLNQLGIRPSADSSYVGLRVGLVAMLRPEKRIDLFVKAARLVVDAYPDTKFFIAGEGKERRSLEFLIQELRLQENVTLLGEVKDIASFTSQLDIGVLCSESEGLSNALIEYMAAGLAVIATAVGGNKELIEHGETGLLVPTNDAQSIAASILRLRTAPLLRLSMANSAHDAVRKQFSAHRIVKQYEEFYRGLHSLRLNHDRFPRRVTDHGTNSGVG